jgi:hypothetical protein
MAYRARRDRQTARWAGFAMIFEHQFLKEKVGACRRHQAAIQMEAETSVRRLFG